MTVIPVSEYAKHATHDLARYLLGKIVVRETAVGVMMGRIVETEAYTQNDPANHAYHGQTVRDAPMFGPAGTVYVYLIYGMYCCLNVVSGPVGCGEAVLVRALAPVTGGENMSRAEQSAWRKCYAGPGRLSRSMGIDRTLNRHSLDASPLYLAADAISSQPYSIVSGGRVGISNVQAAKLPYRYTIAGSEYISRPVASDALHL